MPKFSIIVPVYNTEKYLDRCLDSIEKQTFDDYEAIIVNDGSTDDSKKIIDKYLTNEKFKCINKTNGGLSDARNVGVDSSDGDYLIFLDSDDYISYKTLETINKSLDDDIDVLKFQCVYVYDDYKKNVGDNFEDVDSGKNILLRLINDQCNFEPAWLYAYKSFFWKQNSFKYELGICHEDFALTPYVLFKAKKVKVISDCLYYYVQVDGSITRNRNYKKIYRNVCDMYKGFEINYKNINDSIDADSNFKKVFNSYLANIVIKRGQDLNKDDRKIYYKKLKDDKIYDMLLSDTFGRKIKKMLLKINAGMYFKLKGGKI